MWPEVAGGGRTKPAKGRPTRELFRGERERERGAGPERENGFLKRKP